MLHEGMDCDGRLRFYLRPANLEIGEFLIAGAGELVHEVGNVVVNQFWLDLLAQTVGLAGASNLACGILALGTGAGVAPSRTDTALGTEWNRYATVSASTSAVDPPSGTASFFSPSSDGAVTLTEAGLFYAGATTAAGTGRMASHAAFAYAKPNTLDLRIDYALTRSTAS